MIYGTIEGADAYHLARGNAAWTGTDDVKASALLRAADYIDQTYRLAFPGYRTDGRSQPREWPREDAWVQDGNTIVALPDDEIPPEVEQAGYEAALRELTSPGSLTPDVVPGQVAKSEKVGPISVEYWSDDMKPVIQKIGLILSPILEMGYSTNPLSGKAVIA